MIADRINYAAVRGFSFDIDYLRHIIRRIADGGRVGWSNDVPRSEALRSFQARHSELSFKNHERKDAAKLAAEDAEHLKSFSKLLTIIEERNPGIFADPCRLWNVDETAVQKQS